MSIFSTDDDDLVLTRVRHSCFCTSLQGEIQYSFDRQAVLDKSKKTLGIHALIQKEPPYCIEFQAKEWNNYFRMKLVKPSHHHPIARQVLS